LSITTRNRWKSRIAFDVADEGDDLDAVCVAQGTAATALDALQGEIRQWANEVARYKAYAEKFEQENDALQARVSALQQNNEAMAAQIKMLVGQKTEWMDRATSAAQERDELRGLLLLCGELGGIGKDETPAAYLRRLIDGLIDAHRERDEAYERAAQCAECIADEYDATSFTSVVAGQVAALRSKEQAAHEIAAAIRRLAAGTEKEGE